ncbi:MAG: M67 family metallopeptidase [Planctomycetota bacterium]|jgi:proteasome lid subunit RPN8/RPN11
MLVIPKAIFDQMIEQAKTEAPIEACGILAGRDKRVEKLYEMTNADNSNDHFMMEPTEQFAVLKDIRSAGLEMQAIYHSHPATQARPSAEDIRLALTPEVTYVILSLQPPKKPDVKGFAIEDSVVTPVPVRIEQKAEMIHDQKSD